MPNFFLVVFVLLSVGVAIHANADDAVGVNDNASTQPTTKPTTHPWSHAILNPKDVIDRLVLTNSASDWSDGTMTNAVVKPETPAHLELGYKTSSFPRIGTWTGPEVESDFDFTQLIASFNPMCPPNTGITMDVRVEQAGTWSPWIYLQSWGKYLTPPDRAIKWDAGHADVDTLFLDKPATKYQTRLTLVSFDFDATKNSPTIRHLATTYTGVVSDPAKRAKIYESIDDPTTRPTTIGNWARDLDVPFRGQGDYKNPRAIWGMICSPTSTSMVLSFYGVDRTTVENAMAIYDPQYDMFGNWGRAVSRAGELGLEAELQRFRNWDQVHAMIAQGTPVVASIRFRKGEVKGFLYESTAGHLIVIRGFKPNGDVIVNDPARREKGNGVVYQASEMAKAWFDNGGVGYVIRKPASVDTTVAQRVPENAP
jgi:Peptidase_C39 like family